VTLVHPKKRLPVAATRLIEKCTLFKTNLALVGAPYAVKSAVPIRVFREFLSALEGGGTEITNANFAWLSLLCAEFGFEAFAARLSEFRSSAAFAGEVADAEARARIAALEERAHARDKDVAALQAEVARLSAAVNGGEAQARVLREGQARASAAVEGLRAEVSALKAPPSAPPGAAPELRPLFLHLRKHVLLLLPWPRRHDPGSIRACCRRSVLATTSTTCPRRLRFLDRRGLSGALR
jgi:hypothetical protein